jgi:hypothetical protein
VHRLAAQEQHDRTGIESHSSELFSCDRACELREPAGDAGRLTGTDPAPPRRALDGTTVHAQLDLSDLSAESDQSQSHTSPKPTHGRTSPSTDTSIRKRTRTGCNRNCTKWTRKRPPVRHVRRWKGSCCHISRGHGWGLGGVSGTASGEMVRGIDYDNGWTRFGGKVCLR